MNDSESKSVHGSCYCGEVAFEAQLPSKFCAHCHCSNCRRAHGAAFVTWVGFLAGQVKITSGVEMLGAYKTETGATRSFCQKCGTTLFFESPRWKGEIHIVRSNIEGAIDREPDFHIYVDHKAPWFEIADGLPQRGGESGNEPKD